MSRLGYLFGEGIRGIFKHGFMSFATVAIIMACLIIMGSVMILSLNIDVLIKDLENQNEIVAFVDEQYSDDESKALMDKIKDTENVSSAIYVSRDDAWANFSGNYDSQTMEGIDSSVLRNRYVIKLTDIAKMAQTMSALEAIPGIVKIKAHIDYANSFIMIRNVVSVVSLALIAMLVFVSFFIMSNTIKLATYGRKEEIGIMKMVGAGNGFIKLPFVIEGLILGTLGSALAFFAMWGLYDLVTERLVETMTGQYINFIPFESVMIPIGAFFLGVGLFVGAFGGVNAIRNYLKV